MSKLKEIFNPTPEQNRKLYNRFNELMKEDIERHGNNCRVCAHAKTIYESHYNDYIACTMSDKTVENYETRVCDKFLFMGWF